MDFGIFEREPVVMRYATNLQRARGLGSAKTGVSHWIIQRVTAVLLIPLSVWFVAVFIMLLTAPFEQVVLWLTSLWRSTLTILFILTLFYHGALGIQVILEDYVPHELTRWGLIMATKCLSGFLALLATVSILKVYLS
jgi:succinate dehydrogenase / fumarate reductase membrane anchor subunit